MNIDIIHRCTKCLLPTTYPDVSINDQGECNHCVNYKKQILLGEDLLLHKIKSKTGEKYDCVVGISGGKDSCYVAYLAKKVFNLRVVAVSYDFPFMVELARKNARTVCDSLGIELLVVKSHNNFEYNLLRNHFISLAGTGTTWGQCMFCHYGIEAILNKIAGEYDIPFILSGVTSSEVWWNPGNRIGILAKRLKQLPVNEKLRFAFYQCKAYSGLVDQRIQFPLKGNNPLNVYSRARVSSGSPEIISVFDYIPWDQKVIENTLMEETGWERPNQLLSWRYDCILEPLLDYTFFKEFGISSSGLYLCGLIRAGVINREDAYKMMSVNEDETRMYESLKFVLDYLKIPSNIQQKYLDGSIRK